MSEKTYYHHHHDRKLSAQVCTIFSFCYIILEKSWQIQNIPFIFNLRIETMNEMASKKRFFIYIFFLIMIIKRKIRVVNHITFSHHSARHQTKKHSSSHEWWWWVASSHQKKTNPFFWNVKHQFFSFLFFPLNFAYQPIINETIPDRPKQSGERKS